MSVIVKKRQSLFDIAKQECGTIEAVFELAQLNNLSITDKIEPGTVLETGNIIEKKVTSYYKTNKIFPATDITDADYNETIENEGIEFWEVEKDFVIS